MLDPTTLSKADRRSSIARLYPELRERMGQAAVRAAKSVNYSGAGTIEFLLDREGNFYFMEMNTRIQVEHPVTELITGIDLVKEQILVAAGKHLAFTQEDVSSTVGQSSVASMPKGRIKTSCLPRERLNFICLPVDPVCVWIAPAIQGYRITPHYDSMIAKLIVWGEDRQEAIRRMNRALREFAVDGVYTTIPFHLKVINHSKFISGDFHIQFLETTNLDEER